MNKYYKSSLFLLKNSNYYTSSHQIMCKLTLSPPYGLQDATYLQHISSNGLHDSDPALRSLPCICFLIIMLALYPSLEVRERLQHENMQIVKNSNGVLCKDTADSFSDSLEKIKLNMKSYNSKTIVESISGKDWRTIAYDHYHSYFLRLL